jgi:hypothetical protein
MYALAFHPTVLRSVCREEEMPYQVKVGSVTAIVANEREALEMIRRLMGTGTPEVFVKDIFGSEVDVATIESRLNLPPS